MPAGMPSEADKKAMHDYYRVLNVLLTVGVVMEVMVLPPVIDRQQGLFQIERVSIELSKKTPES